VFDLVLADFYSRLILSEVALLAAFAAPTVTKSTTVLRAADQKSVVTY